MLAVHRRLSTGGALELPFLGLEAGHIEITLIQQIGWRGPLPGPPLFFGRRSGRCSPARHHRGKTTARPSLLMVKAAFSCLKRPSAVRFFGIGGGIVRIDFPTQPKRCGSLGCLAKVEPLVKSVPAKARILGGQAVAAARALSNSGLPALPR